MSKITIQGPTVLKGDVRINGSKNAALPILIATVLLDGESQISNVPNLTDIITTIRLLRSLGLKAEFTNNLVRVWGAADVRHVAPYELITNMRASFLVAGPILARAGFAKVPYPGGCSIGSRPVDIHLKGFEAFGVDIRVEHGFVILKSDKEMAGAKFNMDFPSVGATENLMMFASLAKGTTILKNVAREPEIVDLADFLNKAGADITGAGTDTIKIKGVEKLKGIEYSVIPDRIEAATFLLAAAITRGDVVLKKVKVEHIHDILQVMEKIGVNIQIIDNETVRVKTNGQKLKAVNVKTEPYPGFSTDMQPLLMAFLTTLDDTKSTITETIFENRFMHVMEMNRMGANIEIDGKKAIIHGINKLSGTSVKGMDLRGGAALLIAALAAEGETTLYNVQHILRGYENITEKLIGLGASIV
ncbi:MAG: UDP-N-acetylglucosamine 1-carboxyvinyltransferase [Candidatus Margulisbacteria bacterium]|nr:UDP-N-acetylglucosamine 1-carboxyvinyltransferase [Candidatus Margulisiibacteriota bacterium]